MGSILTMYGATTGGAQNAFAQIDIPFNTDLLGVKWAAYVDLDADSEAMLLQLSFGPTMVQANDSRSILDTVVQAADVVTSGLALNGVNQYSMMPDIQLMGGERVYLHAVTPAATLGIVWCFLHISGDLDKPSSRRRN